MSAEAIATSLRAAQLELGEIREAPAQVRDALKRIAESIAWADALTHPKNAGDTETSIPQDLTILQNDQLGHDPMGHDRIFAYVAITGIVYSDRRTIEDGDYKRLGFLPFRTLEPDIEKDCPEELVATIRERMARIQARRGEAYGISTSGQTVILGT